MSIDANHFRLSVALCILVLHAAGCGRPEQGEKPVSRSPAGLTLENVEATGADSIEGKWKVVKAVINGEVFPKEGEEDIHVGGFYEFRSGKLTKSPNPKFLRFGALTSTRNTYTLVSTKSPPQIEVQEEGKGPSGEVMPSEKLIYKLDDGRLILCWSLDPLAPRPEDFETRADDDKGLYVLQRKLGDTSTSE